MVFIVGLQAFRQCESAISDFKAIQVSFEDTAGAAQVNK